MTGYRTYIIAALVIAASTAKFYGMIDLETYEFVLGLLGAGAAVTLRAGSKNDAKAATQDTCSCIRANQ